MKSHKPARTALSAQTAHEGTQLRLLFDNTNEHAICLLGETGNILSWNLSAMRLMGYKEREVLGKNYSIFFSPDELRRNTSKKALTSAKLKGHYSADGIRIRKDGTYFWARSFLTPVRPTADGPTQFVLITHDISKARAIEKDKEAYIGIASHELRNPIQTISMYSELLGKRLAPGTDDEDLQTLRDMQGQTARLVELIDDLLMISKVESEGMSLVRETFDPVSMLKKVVSDYRGLATPHTITFKGTQGQLVRADKGRITQVFVNLLTNAVKYSPQPSRIIASVERKSGKCVISVRDFGSGIAQADQKHIFKRFYRAERQAAENVSGVGLGLYISKEIIKKHRERLWVESSVGRGSTFSFTLPFAQKRA